MTHARKISATMNAINTKSLSYPIIQSIDHTLTIKDVSTCAFAHTRKNELVQTCIYINLPPTMSIFSNQFYLMAFTAIFCQYLSGMCVYIVAREEGQQKYLINFTNILPHTQSQAQKLKGLGMELNMTLTAGFN